MSDTAKGPRAAVRGSLRRQLIVLSATTTAFAVVLLVLLVQLLLARTSASSIQRVLEERMDAVISSAQAATTGEELVVPDSRLDAGVAVYDDEGRLVAGSPPAPAADLYAELSTVTASRTVTLEESSTVSAEPFTITSGVTGVVVVSERVAPYEQAEHYALVVSIGTGLLAVVASAVIAAFVSRRALAPVLAMATTAEEWSERDLTSRFELGTGDNELTVLGHTLDSLLDKVAAAIRSEQRLTSELAHELRTPLTSLRGTADLMALRPDLDPELRIDVEEVRDAARRMADTITVLLELARSTSAAAAPTTCDLGSVLTDVVADLGEQRTTVRIEVPDDLRLGLPHALAVRALGPVVDNAVRHGDVVVVRSLPGRPGRVVLAVDDNGEGVAADLRERIFEPGQTSGQSPGHGGGAGLGLSLARRIARSAGGDVRLDASPRRAVERSPTGARFVVELPGG